MAASFGFVVIGLLGLQYSSVRTDATAFLERIAWAYEQITDYRVEVETKVTGSPFDVPATKRRFVLAASKPKLWYVYGRLLAPVRDELLMGFDGQVIWAFKPRSKEYVVNDETVERKDELLVAGRGYHFQFFRRFELIDRNDARVDFRGYRTQSDGRRNVRCTVLRLSSDEKDWTEEIWVDPQRDIVLKSVLWKKALSEGLTTETVWRNIQINESIDPSLFRFAPPQGAKRTNTVPMP